MIIKPKEFIAMCFISIMTIIFFSGGTILLYDMFTQEKYPILLLIFLVICAYGFGIALLYVFLCGLKQYTSTRKLDKILSILDNLGKSAEKLSVGVVSIIGYIIGLSCLLFVIYLIIKIIKFMWYC